MTCQLQKDGMLEVVSFHEQHNHEFAPSPMKHMLRSKRKIAPAQKAIANDADKSGISIKQTIDLLSMQVGGHENLGFLDYDYKNHVHHERRKALKKGGARKQPKTILTDQSAAMAKAIAEVFVESNHRLCVWHIYQNAAKKLSHVFNSSKQFVADLGNCMYDYEDEDEWLVTWNNMLEKYDLNNNKWLCGIFDLKEKEVMVYGRHIVLADRRRQELQAKFKTRQTTLVLQLDVEILRHAVKLYTPKMFKMFQDEYMKMRDCTIFKVSKSDTIIEYKVKYWQKTQEHLVKYEISTTNVQCSCIKFSFVGILCVHALKVLDKKNIKILPTHYILKRWTQDAKVGTIKNYHGVDIKGNAQESLGKCYSHLCHNFREVSILATEYEIMYDYAKRCSDTLLKDLQEMRKKCYSLSMEDQIEVHDEVVLGDVLQGDNGC
ncbi:protein FAR1-RELATED SEQUENCE 5-like [Quercus suber]|uniref:protein FAR1-RELATED SEQUENCE 5-like n=1 Tax=Quercus suber TaxID=58331 RepID=UPI000CE28D9B|nr:protein FAR1-RELATED SEQUENCE 5-like [Quercus suber]